MTTSQVSSLILIALGEKVDLDVVEQGVVAVTPGERLKRQESEP